MTRVRGVWGCIPCEKSLKWNDSGNKKNCEIFGKIELQKFSLGSHEFEND